MSRRLPFDVPSATLHLLQLLWHWHGHNPVNCFERQEKPTGTVLVHPASQAEADITTADLVHLLELGWLRGRQQLMLTNTGVAVCRRLTAGQPAIAS